MQEKLSRLSPGRKLTLVFVLATAPIWSAAVTGTVACSWDLDGNGDVDPVDLATLLEAFGPNPGHAADFDGDGFVGTADLLALLANWGPCPP